MQENEPNIHGQTSAKSKVGRHTFHEWTLRFQEPMLENGSYISFREAQNQQKSSEKTGRSYMCMLRLQDPVQENGSNIQGCKPSKRWNSCVYVSKKVENP